MYVRLPAGVRDNAETFQGVIPKEGAIFSRPGQASASTVRFEMRPFGHLALTSSGKLAWHSLSR